MVLASSSILEPLLLTWRARSPKAWDFPAFRRDRCETARVILIIGVRHSANRAAQRLVEVRMTTIDDYLPADLVKIHVEGHEPAVIRGMQQTHCSLAKDPAGRRVRRPHPGAKCRPRR